MIIVMGVLRKTGPALSSYNRHVIVYEESRLVYNAEDMSAVFYDLLSVI